VLPPPQVDEATLFLPINGAVVAVQPAGQTFDGLLRILRTGAPITAWLHASQHLLATGREGFEALLSEGIEREQQGQRSDVFGHIQALCSLAEFHVQQAAAERDRRQRILLLSSATELCHKAQRLNIKEQLPELVLGAVALVKVSACLLSTIVASVWTSCSRSSLLKVLSANFCRMMSQPPRKALRRPSRCGAMDGPA
jgi:hypothetical protein